VLWHECSTYGRNTRHLRNSSTYGRWLSSRRWNICVRQRGAFRWIGCLRCQQIGVGWSLLGGSRRMDHRYISLPYCRFSKGPASPKSFRQEAFRRRARHTDSEISWIGPRRIGLRSAIRTYKSAGELPIFGRDAPKRSRGIRASGEGKRKMKRSEAIRRLVELRAEGEEMISLRLAVPAVLVAAAVAGGFTYFVTPPPPVVADQRLPPTAADMTGPDTGTPTNIDQRPSAEEHAAAAFQRAAAAILRRAQLRRRPPMSHQSLGISRCQRAARSRAHDSRIAAGAFWDRRTPHRHGRKNKAEGQSPRSERKASRA